MPKRLEPGVYYGTTTHLYDGGGIAVAETAFPEDLLIPQHEHANPFFCFVLDGHATRSWPGRTGHEAPMGLTLFPAGVPHANCWHGAGGRVLHVEFAARWVERLGGRSTVLDDPGDFDAGPPVWLAQRLAGECRLQDEVTPLAVEGLALELVAACARRNAPAHTPYPPWLARVRELLHDRFNESLSLAEIAAAGDVSADHLAREFRRHFGCTVGDYLRRLRLDFACHRLADGREPLAAIALAAGFADQSHFTRLFRRQMGMTPAAYRAALRASK